jgi:Fe-S-cluster containining protein
MSEAVGECTRCGACCVAPDIAGLDKPLGIRCRHLGDDNLCGIYEDRPQICRDYAADRFCTEIAAPTLEGRVENFLRAFGLEEEAARVRADGVRSMREARLRVIP